MYSGELIRFTTTYANKNVILPTKTNIETTAYMKCLLLIFLKTKSSQEYIQENNESYLIFESAIINIIYWTHGWQIWGILKYAYAVKLKNNELYPEQHFVV